ncbi:hypothetical protein CHELA1G2_13430 [Hyphomicrobiales bacterium]|nr:hypothetical protein CHELA1G2_13430 [Hyphomicrobiales bacterium]
MELSLCCTKQLNCSGYSFSLNCYAHAFPLYWVVCLMVTAMSGATTCAPV